MLESISWDWGRRKYTSNHTLGTYLVCSRHEQFDVLLHRLSKCTFPAIICQLRKSKMNNAIPQKFVPEGRIRIGSLHFTKMNNNGAYFKKKYRIIMITRDETYQISADSKRVPSISNRIALMTRFFCKWGNS